MTVEEKNILRYLKNNVIHYFPYTFVKKYKSENIKVFNDSSKDLRYVIYENKKLYFKRNWNYDKIKNYFNFLLIEQDTESPHCYFSENFKLNYENAIIDVGAAEGNFALSVVEKSKKVYIIEADEDWIEPLIATFEPWKEKVVIINKFIGNKTSNELLKLDEAFKDNIGLIKVDVEGNEMNVLEGAEILIIKNKPQIIVSTYHNSEDAGLITNYLRKLNYDIKYSKGMMIYLDDPKPPYFRKVLVKASKLDS